MSDAVTVVRETERKYEANGALAVADLAELLGLDVGAGAREERLEACYFDTADLRLLRAGVTLRRRSGGTDEGWHLKLPVGPDSREELRRPLTEDRRTPPAELVALARVYVRGTALGPVAELDTERRRWLLSDSDGHALVELVEDHVTAHTLGERTTAVAWCEVEVELAEHGSVRLLDRVDRELRRRGVHRSASASKLGRLLADRVAPSTGRAAGRVKPGSAGEAVLNYLREQTGRLRASDPLVQRDAPDAVHQMRVAARRMRSALQAYRRVVDGAATRELIDELRWLGGELNAARDAEVIEARLVTMLDSLPTELVLGPVAAAVTRSMGRRRAEGRELVVAALASDRYLALHDAIDRLLADPPVTRRARRPARRELARSVARSWRRTTGRMRAVEAAPAGDGRDRALHETRKAAKRLRYAVEVAGPSTGKPAKRFRRHLKAMQSLLGEHHDVVVARPVLRELGAQAHLDGGNGFTFGLLHGLETARAQRAERELPEAWHRLRRRKNINWFAS